MFIDEVAEAIKDVAAAEVLPRFKALAAGEVSEKSPGDFVTIADQECERVLSERLRAIRDVPVVGEEATAADPTLLDQVGSADAAWIVDPIDGTKNFVNGDPDFVVMVAFVEMGATTAAWIWHPERDALLAARRGGRTHRNGMAVVAPERSDIAGVLKSCLLYTSPSPRDATLSRMPSSA